MKMEQMIFRLCISCRTFAFKLSVVGKQRKEMISLSAEQDLALAAGLGKD